MESWAIGERISRENNYNILRIMAAMAVMYGHMYVLMGGAAPGLFANEINSLGFKMLMVLSGYMITQSCIYDSKLTRYVTKRLFRILPALIFYTLIAMFVIGPIFTTLPVTEYLKNRGTWEYLYNIVLNPRFQLPGVFTSNPYPAAVNGSLWGLPIEVACYVLIYIILKLLCKFSWKRVAFGIIIAGLFFLLICQIVFYPEASSIIWGTDWVRALKLCPYFFMGSLFAVTNMKNYCNVQIALSLLMISVAFHSNIYIVNETIAMLVIPYVIISLGECSEPVFSKYFKNIDITYGIYLWGFPVQQILIQILIVNNQYSIGANVMFVLSLIITVVIATVSWFVVEKPASTLMKKVLKKF